MSSNLMSDLSPDCRLLTTSQSDGTQSSFTSPLPSPKSTPIDAGSCQTLLISGHSSSHTRDQSQSSLPDHQKQKIELAINELNLDEDSLKDLKSAFNFSDGSRHSSEDIAGALLRLRNTTPCVRKNYSNTPHLPRKPNGRAGGRKIYSPSPLFYHPSSTVPVVGSIPTYAVYPARSGSFKMPSVRKLREFTSFAIKLKQNEECWEITAVALDFDRPHLHLRLVRYPGEQRKALRNSGSSLECDALVIEGSKFMTLRCADGSILEKSMCARSLIPLGADAQPDSIAIAQVDRGFFKIRISKAKI
ncbi:hypothetical protein HDV03_004958 [Kappamyces sp. JEL0829]|nr:hypothetical protein HDV03_004958 [Kappamyces sp. JEL0829]